MCLFVKSSDVYWKNRPAGVREDVPLKFQWSFKNHQLYRTQKYLILSIPYSQFRRSIGTYLEIHGSRAWPIDPGSWMASCSRSVSNLNGESWIFVDVEISEVGHIQVPSGKLTQLWKITIFHGKNHYKWWFSIVMLNYQKVNWFYFHGFPYTVSLSDCQSVLRSLELDVSTEYRLWLIYHRTKFGCVQEYPLVNKQKAIEKCHLVRWFTHWKWWFSIVLCMFTRG